MFQALMEREFASVAFTRDQCECLTQPVLFEFYGSMFNQTPQALITQSLSVIFYIQNRNIGLPDMAVQYGLLGLRRYRSRVITTYVGNKRPLNNI